MSTRSKKDFLSSNPDTLTDEFLLTRLLDYTAPERSEQHAKMLLSHFGDIAALMDADTQAYFELGELSQAEIELLRLVPALHRRYLLTRCQAAIFLKDSATIGQYLLPLFSGERDEAVYLLSLDSARRVLGCSRISQGSVDSARISVRVLVREALHRNASAVVLAHNHPTGFSMPSAEDVYTTNWIKDVLSSLDISLLDHIVVSNDNYLSLRESGYYRPD